MNSSTKTKTQRSNTSYLIDIYAYLYRIEKITKKLESLGIDVSNEKETTSSVLLAVRNFRISFSFIKFHNTISSTI